jgi:hypothetical protein
MIVFTQGSKSRRRSHQSGLSVPGSGSASSEDSHVSLSKGDAKKKVISLKLFILDDSPVFLREYVVWALHNTAQNRVPARWLN